MAVFFYCCGFFCCNSCGRTGAGKSSVLVALFRLVEPEKESGIFIDGIDCCKLGLRDLRSKLSIIPQDPVLFSGTVRFNLDPFNQYEDNAIWDVLKAVKLVDLIQNEKQGGLDCIVSENGSNFSQGQKQLICFGRALLKNSKILLLDEGMSLFFVFFCLFICLSIYNFAKPNKNKQKK